MLFPLFHSTAGTHRAAKWARKPLRRGIESLGSNGEARCGLHAASPAGVEPAWAYEPGNSPAAAGL